MANEWVQVAECSQIDEDDTYAVEVQGQEVCIYNVSGQFFATDNKCTHGDADLSDGLIQDGFLIECPLHEGTFDIRSGKAMSAPCTESIRCHDVRVDAGIVYLRVVK
ncbi:non-heme iron oxygenase ferredoxin subunit [Alcaligenaceae bacterium]|nr:non-heme iron oxygenase ferredoxin subunit [Alcaligenaceae bacterium]